MKKYLIFAASALALASCSSDDFLGENPGTVQNATTAINFGGEAGKITRTTSNEGDDHVKLDNQFKVYGVKKVSENGVEKFRTVFMDYSAWYNEAMNTTSNTNGWEYVGNKGATPLGPEVITLNDNQFIKYWDYAASEYRFVAGSPISAFTFNQNDDVLTTGMNIPSATISGLAGHIEKNDVGGAGTALVTNPVYVAKPKIVIKDNYKEAVKFEFVRQQAMVRVGIYENIPGYSITEIKFYKEGETTATSNNVILTSAKANYFVGGSDVKGTINYDWTTPSYTYKYDDTGLTKSQNWYAGYFTPHNALATESTAKVAQLYGTDKDMESTTGYFTVLPTPSETDAKPILIKCDYTLAGDDVAQEAIYVKGATAAIPAAFSKWNVNTRYTYLFKISDNTNGYTGDDPTKAGLFPITFDAVVKESTEATPEGTVTTVSTPSITTYQDGSVVENSGIKYVANKLITVKVTDAETGTDLELNETENTVGKVAVYKLLKERTEADLQLDKVTTDEFTDTNKQGVTLATDKKSFTFTPNAAGHYAIQYLTQAATTTIPATPAAYTYKVVEVK